MPKDLLNPPEYPGFDKQDSESSNNDGSVESTESMNSSEDSNDEACSAPAPTRSLLNRGDQIFGSFNAGFLAEPHSFFREQRPLNNLFGNSVGSLINSSIFEEKNDRSKTPPSNPLSPPVTPNSVFRPPLDSAASQEQYYQQLQQQLQTKHSSVQQASNFNNLQARDQNPPCNTLYVGNLPSSTNPEELEVLFSHCRGYKRLCFRMRSNGPMCFVEVPFT